MDLGNFYGNCKNQAHELRDRGNEGMFDSGGVTLTSQTNTSSAF